MVAACRYRAHHADRACDYVERDVLNRDETGDQSSAWLTVVEEKLGEWWSPQQVVLWLKRTYPDHEEMWVSHETIYLSLFVQGKGALRRELTECLRTGRAVSTSQNQTCTFWERTDSLIR